MLSFPRARLRRWASSTSQLTPFTEISQPIERIASRGLAMIECKDWVAANEVGSKVELVQSQ